MATPITINFPADLNEMFERVQMRTFGNDSQSRLSDFERRRQARLNGFDDFFKLDRPDFGSGRCPNCLGILKDATGNNGCMCTQKYQKYQENPTKNADIVSTSNGFNVTLDVHDYKPHELTVRMIDNVIVVEGKSEDTGNPNGFVSKNFLRQYTIPTNCDVERISSSLSSEGKLSVKIPPKQLAITNPKVNEPAIQKPGLP